MGDVVDRVRTFLETDLRVSGARALAVDYPLIARGAIDSIEIMQVVAFLEEAFGIRIADTEVLPENIGSLKAMEAFVGRKLGAKG